jgi:hypothetical protein
MDAPEDDIGIFDSSYAVITFPGTLLDLLISAAGERGALNR